MRTYYYSDDDGATYTALTTGAAIAASLINEEPGGIECDDVLNYFANSIGWGSVIWFQYKTGLADGDVAATVAWMLAETTPEYQTGWGTYTPDLSEWPSQYGTFIEAVAAWDTYKSSTAADVVLSGAGGNYNVPSQQSILVGTYFGPSSAFEGSATVVDAINADGGGTSVVDIFNAVAALQGDQARIDAVEWAGVQAIALAISDLVEFQGATFTEVAGGQPAGVRIIEALATPAATTFWGWMGGIFTYTSAGDLRDYLLDGDSGGMGNVSLPAASRVLQGTSYGANAAIEGTAATAAAASVVGSPGLS